MSRIGRQPVIIPEGVTVTVTENAVIVKGPKGEIQRPKHRLVSVEQKDKEVLVSVKNSEAGEQKALWGLTQRLIANMVIGVTEGFSKQLEVNGVGFKASVQGKKLVLNLGFSHPIEYAFPEGIDITVEKNVITISGRDNQVVGQVAAEIRAFKKPEPYKGKGIKYIDEHVRRKVGKAAGKGE